MSMYDKNHYNIVISLQLIKINGKKNVQINFLKTFLMWTIFKVFVEYVPILLLFYVLVFGQQGMRDLSLRNKD